MQTFTLGLGAWLRRLTSRNPLVRAGDRAEAAAVLLVFIVALFAAPLAGAMGTAIYDDLSHRYAADRLARQEVQATVTTDSTSAPRVYEKPFLTSIRWELRGIVRTEELRTDRRSAGDRLSIWVDADGNRAAKPLTDSYAATAAVMSAFGLWFAAVGVVAAAYAVLRLWLDRSRHAGWDRALEDLADNGGRKNHNS